MVLQLILKSFIHFEFILVYGVGWWSSLIFFISPNTIYWGGYFYSILCFCSLCQILIDHRDMGLFLGSLYFSLDMCICSYTSTRLFWLQWPCNIVWYQVLWSLLMFFFLKIVEAIWGHLWFHINFWNVCSTSVKYVVGILIGSASNL